MPIMTLKQKDYYPWFHHIGTTYVTREAHWCRRKLPCKHMCHIIHQVNMHLENPFLIFSFKINEMFL